MPAQRHKHQDYRLAVIAGGFWVGCYLAKKVPLAWVNPLLLTSGTLFLVAIAIGWLRPRHSYPYRISWASAIFIAALIAGTITGVSNNRTIVADPISNCEAISLRARAQTVKPIVGAATPRSTPNGQQQNYTVQLGDISWCANSRCFHTRLPIKAVTSASARPGDYIYADAKCQRTKQPWASRETLSYLTLKDVKVKNTPTFARHVTDRIAASGAREAPFLIAVLTGDMSALPVAKIVQLQDSGLAHLLAVSGLHLSILIGFALLILVWAPRYIQFLGIMSVIALAFALVGWRLSLMRAAVMAIIGACGILWGRRTYSFAALAVALILILLSDPAQADSFSLGLSFLVTASLLGLSEPITRKLQHWFSPSLSKALAVPLAAQGAAIPLIAAMTGVITLSAVPANLLALPAATPLLIATLIIAVSPHNWIGQCAVWVADLCARWIFLVAATAARIVQIPWLQGWGGVIILLLCAGGCAYWFWQVQPRAQFALWRDYWAGRK